MANQKMGNEMKYRIAAALVGLSAMTTAPADAQSSPTLTKIRERGHIICGTSPGVAGFSIQDAAGRWNGFDVDICRALAVAIFDDQDKAKFVSLTSKDRLIALPVTFCIALISVPVDRKLGRRREPCRAVARIC